MSSHLIGWQPIAYGSCAILFITYFSAWLEFPMRSTGTISEVFGVFAAAVSPEWLQGWSSQIRLELQENIWYRGSTEKKVTDLSYCT